jgi:hypothetical protein
MLDLEERVSSVETRGGVMGSNAESIVKASAQRLFPDLSLDQVLAELLLERARKNLIKYKAMACRFESKYGVDFGSFRQQMLDSEPSFEMEQDYFDWELAVTGIADMEEETEAVLAAMDLP